MPKTPFHRLARVDHLPSVPPIVMEALQLLTQADVNAATIAYVIERDQALTARLLRMANSPLYGFPRRITTVRLAISLLGNDAVRELLVAATLYELLHTGPSSPLEPGLFWRYCLYCAAAARCLARHLGYRLAGEAFTAGLLHDIGVLLIATYLPAEFLAIKRHQQSTAIPYTEAEYAVLGTTHAELGSWLAERWQLPTLLTAAIAYHHTEEPPATESPPAPLFPSSPLNDIAQPLTALVALGESLAYSAGLRQWYAVESTPCPLYIPPSLRDYLLARSLIEASGAPTPPLKEEVERVYQSLSTVMARG